MQSGKIRQRKAGNRLLKKFLAIVCSLVGSFILIGAIGVYALLGPAVSEEDQQIVDIEQDGEETENTKSKDTNDGEENQGFLSNLLKAPRKTNFVIMGTDYYDRLADVIILGCFDSDTCQIDLINIPRDTYTTLSSELRADLEKAGQWVPQVMKINELHSYGGDMGGEAVKRKLEDSFNIEIDYIVEVGLDGFKQIVDTVGPVEMEIPAGGLYYYDPTQNLRINVPGGVQQLNGELAEGVVRYRATYARGDLQRIEVQQEFLKALFAQALNKDTLIKNATSIIGTLFEYVETDFDLLSLPKYLPYVSSLSGESLETHTLPGEARTINGISYYLYDTQEAQELMDSIFKTYAEEEADIFSSQNLKIQLYNGGGSAVKALALMDSMTEDGLHVMYGGTYTEGTVADTQIMVLKDGQGEDLLHYFKDASIKREFYLEDGFDIVIIIGENEFSE